MNGYLQMLQEYIAQKLYELSMNRKLEKQGWSDQEFSVKSGQPEVAGSNPGALSFSGLLPHDMD